MRLTWEDSGAGGSWAHIFSLKDGFIFAGQSATKARTRRHPAVVLISQSGKPFSIEVDGERLEGMAMLVAPRVPRTLIAQNCGLISLHIEPGHRAYPAFAMMEAPVRVVDPAALAALDSDLLCCLDGTLEPERARALIDTVAHRALEAAASALPRDRRFVRVLSRLMEQSPLDYDFETILSDVGLSSSRFSHLFTQEAGLPLRSFMMWRKSKEAIRLFNTGMNLTEIAHAAGFSDSAHFCRSFHNTLGLLPSMMAGGRYVQVVNWEGH